MSDETREDTLLCFLTPDRMCGADCMAYVTFPRTASSSELSEHQAHCILLSSAERVGRNITILASDLVKTSRRQRIAAADKAREASTPKPPINPFPKP